MHLGKLIGATFALAITLAASGQQTAVSIPKNATGASNVAWSSTATYQQGQDVQYGGMAYRSLTFGNRGLAPSLYPSQWWCLSCNTGAAGPTISNLWSVGAPSQANGNEGDVMNTFHGVFYGGGRNMGPVFSGGWRTNQLAFFMSQNSVRGIHHTLGWNIFDAATGDSMAALGYGYFFFQGGGGTAASDEGKGLATLQLIDEADFVGTIASGSTNTVPVLNQTAGSTRTVDGSLLLDISAGTLAGHFSTAGVANVTGLPTTAVSGVTLPLTTAWGVTSASIGETGLTPDHQSGATSVAVTMGAIGGNTPAFTTGWAIIAGPEFAEQVQITAVTSPSSGTQTLTFTHHYPHSPGARIFQGGVAGMALSSDEVLALTAQVPAYQGEGGGRRTGFHVYGSLTGSDIIWARDRLSNATYPVALGDGQSGISTTGGFHLYPAAEIVANLSELHAPQLEPNPWPWTVGDTVEDAHPDSNLINGFQTIAHITTPVTDAAPWLSVFYDGAGASNAFKPILVHNNNPCGIYAGCGGALSAPDVSTATGPHERLVVGSVLPGGAGMDLRPTDGGNGAVDIFRTYCLSSGQQLPQCNHLAFDPVTNQLSWNGDWKVPNATGYTLSRSYCFGFAYNAGGSPYAQMCNSPEGGGVGSTYVSFDSVTRGDHQANIRANGIEGSTVTADNGWTGTCTPPKSVVVANGIITACQ